MHSNNGAYQNYMNGKSTIITLEKPYDKPLPTIIKECSIDIS